MTSALRTGTSIGLPPRQYPEAKRLKSELNSAASCLHLPSKFDSDGDDSTSNKSAHPRRWSEEEDELLRMAVEKHDGMNWKEIAAEVKTRNHVQCLQRWKKVLTPGLVKGQWSKEEDELLIKLVEEGHKNWGALAARIPGRTSKQCRERWCHHLDPHIVKGEWTSEEDRTLIEMHKELGNKWATIAQHLNGRTENATKIRWKILERNIKNGKLFNVDKTTKAPRGNAARQGTDNRMRCLAAQAAASAMSKAKQAVNPINPVGIPENPSAVQDVLEQIDMSKKLPLIINGSGFIDIPNAKTSSGNGQARKNSNGVINSSTLDDADQRGKNRVTKKRKMPGGDPQPPPTAARGISAKTFHQGQWTGGGSGTTSGGEGHCCRRGWLPDEDARLRQAVEKYGERNWRHVAQAVGTRTHIQCQQRWKKALRPGLVKGAWSMEEDENLVNLIGQGFTNWSELAIHTPGRTAKQCRERWCHHLDPSVNHGSWTEEEDRLLCSLESRLGTKWAAIAREMPGRTEHAVKGRFKTLMRESRVDGASNKARKGGGVMGDSNNANNGSASAPEDAPHQPVGDELVQEFCLEQLQPDAIVTPPNVTEVPPDATAIQEDSVKQENESEPGAPAVPCTSIARLLSVSTASGDTLPEITSGLCGAGLGSEMKSMISTTSTGAPINGTTSVVHSKEPYATDSAIEPNWHQGDHQAQSRADLCSGPFVSAASIAALSPAPSIMGVEKPSHMDYSDLASILMDNATKTEDAVEPGSDLVTLGGDPYSDYSLPCTPHIMPYNSNYSPAIGCWSTSEQAHEPTNDDERVGFSDLDGVPTASTDFADEFGVGVFDRGDPCDPYF